MKKLSIYVKGNRQSTAYYRIYQYFDKIDSVDIRYNEMYPLWVQNNFMPVSEQNIVIKVIVYIAAFLNVSLSLFRDLCNTPDVIVIHKRVISKFMPAVFKAILNCLSRRKCFICWDFDDDIVEGGEMSQKTFLFMANISNRISVTHYYLKSMLPERVWNKTFILPTTDGDMYEYANDDEVISKRLKSFENNLILVWLATASNLKNLTPFIPSFDEGAKKVLNSYGKKVILKVVCDKPLICETNFLQIENIRWSRAIAIETLKESHVGIMPLLDIKYNKGKGGFKLVQYMSIGLPSIGSDIGFNNNVIGNNCGMLCKNMNDWVNAIVNISDINLWKKYSQCAYNYWISNFSYDNNLKYWKNTINEINSHQLK